MKKLLVMLFISILTLSGGTINVSENNKTENPKYYSFRCGYIGELNYSNPDTSIIIKSKEELDDYLDKYNEYDCLEELKEYDKEFFKTKSLVLKYFEFSSGSNQFTMLEPTINGETIIINYKVYYPRIGTCDMNGQMAVIEVGKDIKKIETKQEAEHELVYDD